MAGLSIQDFSLFSFIQIERYNYIFKLKYMKKNGLLWICALFLMIAGVSSCSRDDDDPVFDDRLYEELLKEDFPEGLLNQTTTEFTGEEWFFANAPLWGQGYIQEGNLKVRRNSLGAIEAVDFTGAPAEERPKTVSEFYERYFGEGVVDYFKCTQHTEWDSGMHFETHDYYQQYYKDVIVKTSSGCISFIDDLMVSGSCDYLPIKDFDVTPSFSKGVAIKIFKSFMKLDDYDENRCELQIVRVPEGEAFGPRLVYEVRNGLEGLVIDACSGRALYRTSYDWGL